MLCPCSLIKGMNMEMIPNNIKMNRAMVSTTESMFGTFNLSRNKLMIGRATSERMVAITRYTMTD